MPRSAMHLSLFVAAFLAIPALAQDRQAPPSVTPPQRAMPAHPLAQTLHAQLQDGGAYRHLHDLRRFYQRNEYAPLWLDENGGWKRKPDGYAQAIAQADKDGLNPAAYPLRKLAAVRVDNPDALVRKDIALTDTLLAYIDDLHNGVVEPQQVFPDFFTPDTGGRDLAWRLEQVLEASDAQAALEAQAPRHAEYIHLREALANYRDVAAKGGWPAIDESGGAIRPGWADARIPAIRERLRTLGRLDDARDLGWFAKLRLRISGQEEPLQNKPVNRPDELPQEEVAEGIEYPDRVYDPDLVAAIERFQERRGAKVDGIIGPETLAELNIPVEGRIDQILMAMEQWRWLPQELGTRYVFVNTAGYYAKAVADGETVVHTPVIVGEIAHQTPSFSSYITNVKFYPDWTVPSSIAKRYVLDKIRKNPAVIGSLGYQLYRDGQQVALDHATLASLTEADFPPYRFRQKPGPDNALGLVRFSVENDYAIYLHDTPNDRLFAANSRNFSSGCVRVGEPVKLAQFLLTGNSSLPADAVADKFAVARGADVHTEIVPLEHKIPVHIMYMTAWVDEGGVMHFESDAYGRDDKLREAMGL